MNTSSNGQIRAVLIEDNSADAYWLEMVLVEMDRPLLVERFENGVDALESFRSGRRKPDVLLLDWRLPLLEAPEVIAEVRALPDCADLPIAVFTEFEDQQRQAHQLGAFFVLSKPVGRVQIEGLLEALGGMLPPSAEAELRGPAMGAPFRLGPLSRLRSLHRRAHRTLSEHLALRATLASNLERSYQIRRRFHLG